MAGKGGYQKPSKPAPASGPGRLARRTDGGPAQPVRELPNAQYGEAAEYRTLQQSAPVAATPSVPSGGAPAPGPVGAGGVVGLDQPTANPAQPVTAGAALGAGPGPEALGLPPEDDDVKMRLYAIYQAFPSADLKRLLEQMD